MKKNWSLSTGQNILQKIENINEMNINNHFSWAFLKQYIGSELSLLGTFLKFSNIQRSIFVIFLLREIFIIFIFYYFSLLFLLFGHFVDPLLKITSFILSFDIQRSWGICKTWHNLQQFCRHYTVICIVIFLELG